MIWHSPSAGFSQKIYYQLHPASLALRVCIQILVSSCKSHVKRVRSLEGKRCITRWRKQGLERDRVYGRKQSREEIVKDLEHLLKEVTRVPANRKVLTAIAVQYWPHYIMIECFWESKCIAFFYCVSRFSSKHSFKYTDIFCKYYTRHSLEELDLPPHWLINLEIRQRDTRCFSRHSASKENARKTILMPNVP